MTEDREATNDVRKGEGSDEPVDPYFQLHDELLRRLGFRFERTKLVEQSIARIREPTPESYSMLHEAEICRAAYHIVWQYATRRPGKSGFRGVELGNVMRCVIYLGHVLEDDLALVRHLDEYLDLADLGVELDPSAPGGGKKITGRRGPRPSMLRTYVVGLLRRRFPDWEEGTPFPHEDSQELREWLRGEIATAGRPKNLRFGFSSALGYADAVTGSLFEAEKIDPAPGGPLSTIIENLRRIQ